jgi:hypothetical protein
MKVGASIAMKKETIFKMITISIPFLFFVLLELSLRVAGYGINPASFVEYVAPDGTEYFRTNPEVTRIYFNNAIQMGDVDNSGYFKKYKSEGVYRIFILGRVDRQGLSIRCKLQFFSASRIVAHLL